MTDEEIKESTCSNGNEVLDSGHIINPFQAIVLLLYTPLKF